MKKVEKEMIEMIYVWAAVGILFFIGLQAVSLLLQVMEIYQEKIVLGIAFVILGSIPGMILWKTIKK